eukprot:gnl/TRDRNA2_/TRDRNA2_42431_c0_seq1.p1 gnl/TRDRNA2_/TRDRNA2_42431_c0~~gnl/TRDRNA2_/TRDRNA2_42431_c0_seq1.p1  ORF type:complete len:150 (-),score=33.10 gnl/TRDRNA2_/TRDRNA2_42431_c0_seq1:210-659(-)
MAVPAGGAAASSPTSSAVLAKQYEAILRQLENAMMKQDRKEADRLMSRLNNYMDEMSAQQCDWEAIGALLEKGQYNLDARRRMHAMYHNWSLDSVGGDTISVDAVRAGPAKQPRDVSPGKFVEASRPPPEQAACWPWWSSCGSGGGMHC